LQIRINSYFVWWTILILLTTSLITEALDGLDDMQHIIRCSRFITRVKHPTVSQTHFTMCILTIRHIYTKQRVIGVLIREWMIKPSPTRRFLTWNRKLVCALFPSDVGDWSFNVSARSPLLFFAESYFLLGSLSSENFLNFFLSVRYGQRYRIAGSVKLN
jgi:hypothetical protein